MSGRPVRRAPGTPAIPPPSVALLRLVGQRRSTGLLLATLVVAVVFSATIPAFATGPNLVTMMSDASVIGIAAIGLFLVVLTGGIDLSIGAVAGLAPLVGSLWMGQIAAPLLLVFALLAGGAIGLLSGLLVVGGGLAAFAVTLGVEAVVRSTASALAASPGRVGASVDLLPNLDTTIVGMPASVALLAVVAGLVLAYLAGMRGGKILVAIGSSRTAARAAGLDTFRYGVLPYVASGLLAALAGLLSATAAPSALAITERGGTLTLDALTAVVIGGAGLRGGRGSVPGTLCGVALVVMIRSGLWLTDISVLWQGSAVGVLLLVGLLVNRFTDPVRTSC